MALASGDPMRTVSPTRPSAGSDDRCGFLPRRVAGAAANVSGAALTEGQGERLAELLVVCFQVSDPLGRRLQSPQQGSVRGALPVGNRPPRRR